METKPVLSAEEIEKMHKTGKSMVGAALGMFIVVVVLTAAGGAPSFLYILTGTFLAIGLIQMYRAKKAKAAGGMPMSSNEPKV